MKPSIHEYLQQIRIEQGLSIQKLAELSGVSASHISRIERTKRNPSSDTLSKLAPFLEVESMTLLDMAGLLNKGAKKMDLDQVLEGKPLLYKGAIVPDEVKLKIRALLENM